MKFNEEKKQEQEEKKIMRNARKILEIINRNKDKNQKMENGNDGKYNKTSM